MVGAHKSVQLLCIEPYSPAAIAAQSCSSCYITGSLCTAVTSIPVGDFVFDHGRFCAGTRSCPLYQQRRAFLLPPPCAIAARTGENQTPRRVETSHRQNNHLPRRPRPFCQLPRSRRASAVPRSAISCARDAEERNSPEDFHFAMLTPSSLAYASEMPELQTQETLQALSEIIYLGG